MLSQDILSQSQLRHWIRGRIRLHAPQVKGNPERARALKVFFEKIDQVRRVSVRPWSGSVILEFTSHTATLHEMVRAIMEHAVENLDKFKPCGKFSTRSVAQFCNDQRNGHSKSHRSQGVHLVALWALGGLFIKDPLKRLLWGSSLGQGFFSPTGIVSCLAAMILWKKPPSPERPHHRRVKAFLHTASALALMGSRAVTAAEILFLGHLGFWLETKAEEKALRSLEDCFPSLPPSMDVLEDNQIDRRDVRDVRVGDEVAPLLDAICLDKTGTLTEGLLSVQHVFPRAPWIPPEDVVVLAASAEKEALHPVETALRRHCQAMERQIPNCQEQKIFPGYGVRAHMEGQTILVGSASFMKDQGIPISYFAKKAAYHRRLGDLIVYVAKNNRLKGMITLRSRPVVNLDRFLHDLRRQGFRVIDLLSGDSSIALRRFAEGLAFDACLGEMSPEDKSRWVQERQKQGFRCLMVGDGINDTAAFSKAEVAAALGPHGATAALETADVVVMDGNVRKILLLKTVGNSMLDRACWNFTIAFLTSITGAFVAMTGWVGPGVVGLLHLGHTAAILANSARKFSFQP